MGGSDLIDDKIFKYAVTLKCTGATNSCAMNNKHEGLNSLQERLDSWLKHLETQNAFNKPTFVNFFKDTVQ